MKSTVNYLLIALAITFMTPLSSSGQTNFGLNVGLNTSNHKVKPEIAFGTKYLAGYQLGIWMKNTLSEKLNLSSEIAYSKEGFQFDFADSLEFKSPIRFVNLNTAISYLLVKNLRIRSGPQIGFLISSKWIIDGLEFESMEYEKVSIGWNFGLNYELSKSLMVGFRFHQGFNDISFDILPTFNDLGMPTGEIHIDEFKRNLQINLYYKLL